MVLSILEYSSTRVPVRYVAPSPTGRAHPKKEPQHHHTGTWTPKVAQDEGNQVPVFDLWTTRAQTSQTRTLEQVDQLLHCGVTPGASTASNEFAPVSLCLSLSLSVSRSVSLSLCLSLKVLTRSRPRALSPLYVPR